MERRLGLFVLIAALCFPTGAHAVVDLFSVGVAAASWGFNKVKCMVTECCYGDKWIGLDLSSLKEDFQKHVFGQHLAAEVVVKVLRGHFKNEPKKALVLSFQGGTGSGKNFISDIIANNTFRKGMKSQFVHKYIATFDAPHSDRVEFYKTELRNRIMSAGRKCGRSLFIFDEMDKMPPGLIDVVYPFVDHHSEVGGVNFRQFVFIFLSNTGAQRINNYMLEQWNSGKQREDVTIKELDFYLSKDAYREKDGSLWHSNLIKNHLIDYFVPFLPLERVHIKQCAAAEMRRQGQLVSGEVLNAVANEHIYWPSNEQLYATSGCKKVRSKVDVLSDE